MVCILTENRCYKTYDKLTPKGIVVHSTGANNTMLRRYVQPTSKNPRFTDLVYELGINRNGNAWNRSNIDACVHGFIGKKDDGTVDFVQTLPYDCRGWHVGNGSKGSYNDTHLSFEICEDGLKNESYFNQVMLKAIDVCAEWCTAFDLDPMKDGVLVSHHEAHLRGYASNHGDIDHWLKNFGLNMDWFREKVNSKIMNVYDADKPADWAKEAWDWATDCGITDGTLPGSPCTRQELVTMLYRYHKEHNNK